MASVSKFTIKFQTKSISLPCRSHPATSEIEELISKIRIIIAEPSSSDAICSSLFHMKILYKCMNDLLNSSTTQVLMSHGQYKKWIDEIVDESVRFLDICGSISDMLSEIKDNIRDLLCALRRRKSDHLIIENTIMKYNCFRKKLRKQVKGLSSSLKQVNNLSCGGNSLVVDHSDNNHLAAVIRAVIGVSEVTVLVLESVLMFLSVSVSKPNRWSLVVSKIMHKEMMQSCEDEKENVNEFESIDAALRILCKLGFCSDNGNVQIAQCRLERVGTQIEMMECGLECVFRFLVRTRVSLLNIVFR